MHRGPVAENVIESRQLSLRGIDAAHRGDSTEAEQLFSRAIEKCPADKLAHQRYAELLWQRGIRDAATRHMETAVVLSGGDSALHVQLGEMYLASGNPDLALAQVEQAISADPQVAAAWALQGDVFFRNGNGIDAMKSYHRALALQPDFPRVQQALCSLYLQQDRPRRALATIDSLAATYPPDSAPQQVLILKGIALKQLRRYSTALGVLARAASREDPSADLLLELAETQYLAGDHANARLSLNAALARSPQTPRGFQLVDQMRVALAN